MKVLKFGGTSVQDASAIRRLRDIVHSQQTNSLVVVSALSKVTDALIALVQNLKEGRLDWAIRILADLENRHQALAEELQIGEATRALVSAHFSEIRNQATALAALSEVSPRSEARIVAQGELLSSLIVADFLGFRWQDARSLIRTGGNPMSATVDFESSRQAVAENLQKLSRGSESVVTGGFIASDSALKDVTTVLGRGGSDYSASILGAILGAESIEIWTDVDGVLTSDPRVVPSAKRIQRLSFEEAAELAFFGAKVLHPATIFPAVEASIPVWVLNSKKPDAGGTLITQEAIPDLNVIKAITCKKVITLINIYSTRMLGAAGFLKRVFDTFSELEVSVDSISTSEVNISLTVDSAVDGSKLEQLRKKLSDYSVVTIEQDKSSVALVGKGIRQASGLGARIFGALAGFNVTMISMGSSDVNLGLVVDRISVDDVVKKLHFEFFSGPLNPEIFSEIQ